jgi:iron complex outermembrane receptor protein
MDLANIENIQVLKGAQGTLYGRNATGGAILVNTLGPTREWTGRLEAKYGRFDDKAFTGHVSGPINDRIRFSLSGYYRQTPGYLKLASPTNINQTIGTSPSGEEKKENVRAKFEFDVSDDLTAMLGYSWAYTQDNRIENYTDYEYAPAAFGLIKGVTVPTQYGVVAFNDDSREYSIRNQGQLKLTWRTGIGTLVSATGYTAGPDRGNFDFDSTYLSINWNSTRFMNKIFQESLDYNINAIKNVDLLVGGLYYDAKIYTKNYNGFGNLVKAATFSSWTETNQHTKSWAIYLDATWHATDQLAVNAGGRYSHDTKGDRYTAYALPSRAVTIPTQYNQVTWTKFTPSASIRYELAPRTNVYVSYAQGFRNGNFAGAPLVFPPPVPNPGGLTTTYDWKPNKPEKVDSFELGFKTAQATVRFETAAFYYRYHDIQTNIVVPNPNCPLTCPGGNTFSNGPGAKGYGIDAEVTWAATEQFNIHAGLEWLHARYDHFPNALGTGLNGTTLLNVASSVQDWSGKQLARAPNFSANTTIDYTVPVAGGSLLLTANVNYQTSYALNNVSLYDTNVGNVLTGASLEPAGKHGQQRYRRGAMALVNASATWTSPDGHYYIGIYGENLTNKFYRLNYNGSAFGDYGTRAEPISYGGKVGVKF